jgi:hypothetical protein
MALQKAPHTGICIFRKVIPEPVRPIFGKREYKVSLGTRDLASARARMLAPAGEYERLLEDAQQKLMGGWAAQASSMVERWLQETARDNRWLRFAAAFLTAYTKVVERNGRSGPAPMYSFEPEARDPADDEALRLRAVTARRRMFWPVTQAFDAWRDHKGKKGKPRPPQRAQEWDLAIRRFNKMYGDIDMALIRLQMVRDYRDKLLEIPSRAPDEIKILPLDEQAAIRERDQLDTLAR